MVANFPFQYVFLRKSDISPDFIFGIYGRMASNFPFQYVFFRKSDIPSDCISRIYGRMASISPFQYVFCWKSGLSSSPDNLDDPDNLFSPVSIRISGYCFSVSFNTLIGPDPGLSSANRHRYFSVPLRLTLTRRIFLAQYNALYAVFICRFQQHLIFNYLSS